jgi:hypothetical protein
MPNAKKVFFSKEAKSESIAYTQKRLILNSFNILKK